MNEVAPISPSPVAEGPLAAISEEFQRFLVLFDWLVRDTSKWIERTPQDKLDWVPIDNPNVRFGDRVTTVTIRSLFIHVLIAANNWIRDLADCRDGAVIPVASDPNLATRLANGDIVATAARMHEANMQKLRSLSPAQLRKSIKFPGDKTNWTVMGFLWAMYGHHAFHLGNIDLYVRQANLTAPDIFTYDPRIMA